MIFEDIIKQFIDDTPVVRGNLIFPENKHVLLKAFDMDYGWLNLGGLFWKNINTAFMKQEQFKSSYWAAWYWCVDFDLTEEYIWWRVIEGMKSPEYKEWEEKFSNSLFDIINDCEVL